MSKLQLVYVQRDVDHHALTVLGREGKIRVISGDGVRTMMVSAGMTDRALVRVLDETLVFRDVGLIAYDAVIRGITIRTTQGQGYESIKWLLENDNLRYIEQFTDREKGWDVEFSIAIPNGHLERRYIELFSRCGARSISREERPITEEMVRELSQ